MHFIKGLKEAAAFLEEKPVCMVSPGKCPCPRSGPQCCPVSLAPRQHPGSHVIPESGPVLPPSRVLQQHNCKKGANRGKAVAALLSLNIELLQATGGTAISPFIIREMFSLAVEAG